eukprot:SAG31_NODE_15_length_37942_cov_32.078297_17_plen_77_part_00
MSGTACAGIVAAPVGGWISDQVGRPAAIVGGASLLACSAFLLGSGLVANVYSFGEPQCILLSQFHYCDSGWNQSQG